MTAPSVIEQQLIFTLDDPARRFVRVYLDCDDAIVGPRRFRRTSAGWALSIPRPDVARVEYRLVVTDRSGSTAVECDPANPERVPTAFGERSVALMPGYERPDWLQHAPAPKTPEAGTFQSHVHTDLGLGELPIEVWAPPDLPPTTPAPMLIVNDGPEYAELASLTAYAASMIAHEQLPPFRVALFQPVDRDEWYAANPDYVVAVLAAVDELRSAYATEPGLVAMGASLGGLCALLIALSAEDQFAGVFSQSGSFFTPKLDAQESSYPFFRQVSGAVSLVLESTPADSPLEVALTCGAREENFANNQAMAEALTAAGHHVSLQVVPDLHNYTAWRDSYDPSLSDLLRSVWLARG